jgi:hypothetical protein
MGGIWKPAYLVAADREAEARMLLVAIQISRQP